MPWVPRGLRDGILTTRYPNRPDGYGPGYRGAVTVVGGGADPSLPGLCPTGAITVTDGQTRLDRGRCILCGRCVARRPDLLALEPGVEVAALDRSTLVVPVNDADLDEDNLRRARAGLGQRVRALRRSVYIRHVDAGSDGSEEWEVAALGNPVYDIQRLGIYFTASPRHADLLLVTGAGSAGMAGPLRRTWEAMPEPKLVMAAGTDAVSGGLISPTYATRSGVSTLVPVDVWVPGSPPSPLSLLHGILACVGLLGNRSAG